MKQAMFTQQKRVVKTDPRIKTFWWLLIMYWIFAAFQWLIAITQDPHQRWSDQCARTIFAWLILQHLWSAHCMDDAGNSLCFRRAYLEAF